MYEHKKFSRDFRSAAVFGLLPLLTIFLTQLISCQNSLQPFGKLYSITYDGNGNLGGKPPIDSRTWYSSGATATVLDNTGQLTKQNGVFWEWNTARDGSGVTYNAGSSYTFGSANQVLYAFYGIPRTGLGAEWLLNGSLNDTVGTNNGTATSVLGGSQSFTTGRKGVVNEALNLNSPDSSNYAYVSFAPSPLTDISATQSLSVSMWFNPSAASLAGTSLLIETLGLTNPEFNFNLELVTGTLNAGVGQSGVGGVSVPSLVSPTANTWHHAVLVYDGTSFQLSLYLDGSLQGQTTNTFTTATASSAGYVILGFQTTLAYSGLEEQIRIYNRVLSSSEVSMLYNE